MTRSERWTGEDVPDLSGKTVLITGANSGIGLEATRVLAAKGAHVVMACRDRTKAAAASRDLAATHPKAETEFLRLDLADLASVRQAAEEFADKHPRLDVLINNAGVMFVPQARTVDGFEMQMGTNHFGHFALTGLLLERLLETAGSRVVTVSSVGHRPGSIDFDDLNWERRYNRFAAYFRSKLANLLFTYELQRRLHEAKCGTIAVAAHPGAAKTNLGRMGRGQSFWWVERMLRPITALVTQSAAMGALPTLRAATDSKVHGSDYFGPDGLGEQWGYPIRVKSSQRSHDRAAAARLWRVSEQLTGVTYEAVGGRRLKVESND